eukprot:scaffold646982_cov47-Prasinocladus_malaysianus.AAC.1
MAGQPQVLRGLAGPTSDLLPTQEQQLPIGLHSHRQAHKSSPPKQNTLPGRRHRDRHILADAELFHSRRQAMAGRHRHGSRRS